MAIGATGKFPDGKISAGDEGEIAIQIASATGGYVHIEFGKPVAWLAMPRAIAIEFANMILEKAGAPSSEHD